MQDSNEEEGVRGIVRQAAVTESRTKFVSPGLGFRLVVASSNITCSMRALHEQSGGLFLCFFSAWS